MRDLPGQLLIDPALLYPEDLRRLIPPAMQQPQTEIVDITNSVDTEHAHRHQRTDQARFVDHDGAAH